MTEHMTIRDRIMGPLHEVTRECGTKHGGRVLFEQNGWLAPVKEDGRCYMIGPSHQHSRQLISPNVAGKIMDGEMNDDQKL